MPQDLNISVAKIVATPSPSSWSQAYNAGKLFAVLSLEKETEETEEKDYLNILGKDLLETLEQEFFTLEVKDLESIKNSVETTIKKIPENVECSFVIGSIVEQVLYIFIQGEGKVALKRGEDFGTVLQSHGNKLSASSGLLKDRDLIILQTKQFKDIISTNILISSLDHEPAANIAETLAPIIHKQEKGGAAAILIEIKKKEEERVSPNILTEPKEDYVPVQKVKFKNILEYIYPLLDKLKLPKLKSLEHSRKMFLTVAAVVILVLILAVIFAIKAQNNAKIEATFNQIYPQAQKKYDEGQSLLDLNKNLARDSFSLSSDILIENKSKFPKNSKQEKKILELLEKVNKALASVSEINSVEAKNVDESQSQILSLELKNADSTYFTQDEKNIYFIKDGVVSEDKKDNKTKKIINAGDLPKNIGGLGVYFGNIYVLDKNGQILKFVAIDNEFSKTNYFPKDTSPNLSKAQSLTIDGSIWILFSDGAIEKFTKGKSESFNISGLDKPLANPTKIYTNVDSDNLYILDNGNSRIVVLDKNGSYKSQYQTSIIKNTKDFEVIEGGKKIFILSQNKIYQIDLK